MKTKLYIPDYIYESVEMVDYDALKQAGISLLLFDIDNTLVPYRVPIAPRAVKELFARLEEQGFTVMICTNNSRKRLVRFLDGAPYDGVTRSFKPWTYGIRKALRRTGKRTTETALIGDQLKTDIASANRAGITSVLVKSIDRRYEPFYTRINRSNEQRIIARMKKIAPAKAKEIEAWQHE